MAVGRRNAIATDRSRADQGELGTVATRDRRTDPRRRDAVATDRSRADQSRLGTVVTKQRAGCATRARPEQKPRNQSSRPRGGGASGAGLGSKRPKEPKVSMLLPVRMPEVFEHELQMR